MEQQTLNGNTPARVYGLPAWVPKIREWREEGATLDEMCQRLNAAQVPMPQWATKGHWTSGVLSHYILNDLGMPKLKTRKPQPAAQPSQSSFTLAPGPDIGQLLLSIDAILDSSMPKPEQIFCIKQLIEKYEKEQNNV